MTNDTDNIDCYVDSNNNKIFNHKFRNVIRRHKYKAKQYHLNVCEFLLGQKSQEGYLLFLNRSIKELLKLEHSSVFEICDVLGVSSLEISMTDYFKFNYGLIMEYYKQFLLNENIEQNKNKILFLLFVAENSINNGYERGLEIKYDIYKIIFMINPMMPRWDFTTSHFLYLLNINIDVISMKEVLLVIYNLLIVLIY